ncbi:MAG TPA: SGNH/GDSL hydrolase family protein, partial [Candidatus Parcubacteria bacterium]|nr:SGNH/GDSL hydrolase family protein [Candidatus Parcubacteria bacterium]
MIRLFFPSPQSPNIFDEIIGYKYRPNSSVSFFVQGKEIKNKVNSTGFLDEEHNFQKLEGVYRIVFLGDSFTEATNVIREDTFPKILERELNQIYENRIEIINLGMNGFGTAHEYLTLKEYGLKFSPDLVILLFIENDLENNLVKFGSEINPAFDVVEGELLQIRTPRPLKGSGLRSF